MEMNRRVFLGAVGLAASATSTGTLPGKATENGLKIGICDWNLGPSCDPEMIPKARQAQLSGIQVSVGTTPETITLRDPRVLERYLQLGEENGIHFCSVAAGSILNRIPLKSEPQSAIYVMDALEAASVLRSDNILLAFFGKGDLRLVDANGLFRNLSDGTFSTYELDTQGVSRVVDVLKQLVPHAEEKGVVLGLENTLTAEQNLEIIDRVGSEIIQVYYDVGNSTHYGYDVATEIRQLGRERICEIHLKDWSAPVFGSPEGEVDWTPAAEACRFIGYDKWYVLETSGREGRFLEDTRANVEFVRNLF